MQRNDSFCFIEKAIEDPELETKNQLEELHRELSHVEHRIQSITPQIRCYYESSLRQDLTLDEASILIGLLKHYLKIISQLGIQLHDLKKANVGYQKIWSTSKDKQFSEMIENLAQKNIQLNKALNHLDHYSGIVLNDNKKEDISKHTGELAKEQLYTGYSFFDSKKALTIAATISAAAFALWVTKP